MMFLFLVFVVTAALFLVALPFGPALGYVVVLAWTAGILYLIFYRPDRLTAAIADHQDVERR